VNDVIKREIFIYKLAKSLCNKSMLKVNELKMKREILICKKN